MRDFRKKKLTSKERTKKILRNIICESCVYYISKNLGMAICLWKSANSDETVLPDSLICEHYVNEKESN